MPENKPHKVIGNFMMFMLTISLSCSKYGTVHPERPWFQVPSLREKEKSSTSLQFPHLSEDNLKDWFLSWLTANADRYGGLDIRLQGMQKQGHLGWEIKNRGKGVFTRSCLATLPSLSQANIQAPLNPCHSLALELGWTGPGKRLCQGAQRGSGSPGWSPGGATVDTVGVYSNNAPKAATLLTIVWLLDYPWLLCYVLQAKLSKHFSPTWGRKDRARPKASLLIHRHWAENRDTSSWLCT